MKKTRGTVTLLICITVLFFMTNFVSAEDTTADDWITNSGDTYVTNGNVGIGTSSPEVKLDIYEGSAGAAIKVESGLSSSGAVIRTKNDNSANGFFITYGSTYTSNIFGTSRAGYTFFGSDGAGSSGIKIGTIKDTPVIFGQNNVEVMRINTSGNVGIGTNSPGQLLHLASTSPVLRFEDTDSSNAISDLVMGYGQISIRADQNGDLVNSRIDFRIDGDEKVRIDSSGNVGIGTSSPGVKLQVGVDNAAAMKVTDSGDNNYERVALGDSSGNGGYIRLVNDSESITAMIRSYASSGTQAYFTAGNVGIGTTSPDYKLDVLGTIRAEEVKVETGWSDFVFEDDYPLPSLDHVETFIKENKHLPDVPSAEEVKEQGLSVSEMIAKQMQKIEELTLYVIQLQKKNSELEKRLAAVEQEN